MSERGKTSLVFCRLDQKKKKKDQVFAGARPEEDQSRRA